MSTSVIAFLSFLAGAWSTMLLTGWASRRANREVAAYRRAHDRASENYQK